MKTYAVDYDTVMLLKLLARDCAEEPDVETAQAIRDVLSEIAPDESERRSKFGHLRLVWSASERREPGENNPAW